MGKAATPFYWLKTAFGNYFNTQSYGGVNQIDAFTGRQTNLPTDAYRLVAMDETNATNRYYGNVTPTNTNGTGTDPYGWYIMRATLVSGTWAAGVIEYTFATWDNGTGSAVNPASYRQASTGAWATRTSLTYVNFEAIFFKQV